MAKSLRYILNRRMFLILFLFFIIYTSSEKNEFNRPDCLVDRWIFQLRIFSIFQSYLGLVGIALLVGKSVLNSQHVK